MVFSATYVQVLVNTYNVTFLQKIICSGSCRGFWNLIRAISIFLFLGFVNSPTSIATKMTGLFIRSWQSSP